MVQPKIYGKENNLKDTNIFCSQMDLSTASDSLNVSNIISNCRLSKVTFRPKTAKRTGLSDIKEDTEKESSLFLNKSNQSPENTNTEAQFKKQHRKKFKLAVLDSDRKHKNVDESCTLQNLEVEIPQNDETPTIPVKRKKKNKDVKESLHHGDFNRSLESLCYNTTQDCGVLQQDCGVLQSPNENRKNKKHKKEKNLDTEREESFGVRESKSEKNEPHTSSNNVHSFMSHSNSKQVKKSKYKSSSEKLIDNFGKGLDGFQFEFPEETPIKKLNKSQKTVFSDKENTTECGGISQSTPFNFGISNYENKSRLSADKLLVKISGKNIDSTYAHEQRKKHKNKHFNNECEQSLMSELNQLSSVNLKNRLKTSVQTDENIDDIESKSVNTEFGLTTANKLHSNVSKCEVENKDEILAHKIKTCKPKSKYKKKETKKLDLRKQLISNALLSLTDASPIKSSTFDVDKVKKLKLKKSLKAIEKVNNSKTNSNLEKLPKAKFKIEKKKAPNEIDIIRKQLIANARLLISDSSSSKSSYATAKKTKRRNKTTDFLVTKALRNIEQVGNLKTSLKNDNTEKFHKPKLKVKKKKELHDVEIIEQIGNLKTNLENENSEKFHKPKLKVKKKKELNDIDVMRKQLLSNAFVSMSGSSL